MATFNLVFHDMMLFVEKGKYCDVLIPEVKEHDYRYGDPATSFPSAFPANLFPGDYEVTGIKPRAHPDQFCNHADEYLVLKASKVSTVPSLRRIKIRVPLPDEIHLFRKLIPHAGITSLNASVMNGTPGSLLVKKPKALFDVIVFHYLNVDLPAVVFRPMKGDALATGQANLCIYAETGKDFKCMNLPVMAHRTGINDLLHFTSGSTEKHPSFSLSRIGTAADEPNPGLGLSSKHMLSLRQQMRLENDEGGCYGAMVAQRR